MKVRVFVEVDQGKFNNNPKFQETVSPEDLGWRSDLWPHLSDNSKMEAVRRYLDEINAYSIGFEELKD